MKKTLKICLSVALCLLLVGGTMSAGIGGVADLFGTLTASAETSGTCGTNATFSVESGVLTISGSGRMYDYASSKKVPWYDQKDNITKVVISKDISYLSDYSFTDYFDDGYLNIESYEVEEGNLNYAASDGILYKSTNGNAYAEVVKVPTLATSVQVKTVATAICKGAFYNCRNLGNLQLVGVASNGSQLTSIDSYAFYGCSEITDLQMPINLVSIGDYAFAECSKLDNLWYWNGVLKNNEFQYDEESGALQYETDEPINYTLSESGLLTYLGAHVFENCSSMSGLTLKGTFSTIPDYAFYGCTSLQYVDLSNLASLTEIGAYAFNGAYNLKGITGSTNLTITIPSTVTKIGNNAFEDTEAVIFINIPASVTEIGNAAFADCDRLTKFNVDSGNTAYSNDDDGVLYNKDQTELVQYPNGRTAVGYEVLDTATKIGEYAFKHCTRIETVSIPDTTTAIGDYAFYNCPNLRSIVLSENSGLKTIGKYALENSGKINNIVVPASVTKIDETAFLNCSLLSDVYYIGDETGWINNGGRAAEEAAEAANGTDITIHYITTETPTVTYKLDGGSIYDVSSDLVYYLCPCEEEHTLTPDIDPVKPGMIFGGWVGLDGVYQTADLETKLVENKYTSDLTFTALWTTTSHGDHTITLRNQKTANCGQDGYSGDVYCETCQLVLTTGYSIPATGNHSYLSNYDGTKHWDECSVCGDVINEAAHTFKEVSNGDGSCTEAGTYTLVCSVCGYSDGITYTETEPSHSYTTTDYKAATCTEDGYITKTCSVCGDVTTETIPATGHTDENNDGVCDVCNTIYDQAKYDAYYAALTASKIILSIKEPSTTNINYGHTLWLHATTSALEYNEKGVAVITDTEKTLPAGYSLQWSVSGDTDAVTITPSDDGYTCAVKVVGKGNPTISVTLVDSNGQPAAKINTTNVAVRDTKTIHADKNFFKVIVAFVKTLFRFGLDIDK